MHVLQERKPVRIGSGVQPAALMPYLGRGHGTNQKVKGGGPIGKQRLPPSRVEPVQVQLEPDNRLGSRDQPAVGEHVETNVSHGLRGEVGSAGEHRKPSAGTTAQENGA